ncbi:MAG TPA: hemerythrin domain-containing protein [Frankiaceae bacterium]|nr:hemerythrin domain-containing protein [Frankiaceae bacterium]
MPDAITSLRDDHKKVEKLFKAFEKLEKNDGSATDKRQVVGEIIRELSVHAAVEEQVFYPAVRKSVEEAEDVVLEGLEEHHIVKWTLSELEGMNGDEERFDAKVKVLMESVRHHVEEEEQEMFPKVREALGRKPLVELFETMEAARNEVPDTPQPEAPDEAPANLTSPTAAAAAGQPTAKTAAKPAAKGGLLGLRRGKGGGKS